MRFAALIAACLAATTALAEPGSVGHQAAALAALRGDATGARNALGIGSGDPEDPAGLVVMASIALDEGRLDEGARLTGLLETRAPKAADVQILKTLIQVRRAHPKGDWLDAGIETLRRLHPLAETPPLLDPEEVGPAPERPSPWPALARLDLASSFLVRWCWPARDAAETKSEADSLVDDAIRLAASDERLLVHLAVLDVIARSAEGRRYAEAVGARDALVRRLESKAPGAIRFLLYAERPASEPLSEADVAAIEKAVAGAERMPYGAAYRELRDVLDKLDPAMAPSLAMSGAVQLVFHRFHPGNLHHRLRLDGDLSGPSRSRLSRALVRLAELLDAQDTLLTSMMAAVVRGDAAALTKDSKLQDQVAALRARLVELQGSSRCLSQLGRLPIAGLYRAMADRLPNERSMLLVRLHEAGLICPEPEPAWKEKDGEGRTSTQPEGCSSDDQK